MFLWVQALDNALHHATLTLVMSIANPNLKGIVAAIAAIVTFSGTGHAQEADSTDENALLSALSQAGPDEARHLDRQLQALWAKSGSVSADLLLERGRDALEAGNMPAAIEHLTALTDHAPGFAEGWHARASAFYASDLFGVALADLERSLALNAHNYNAIFGLGQIFEALDRPERAYEIYQRALSIHPHHEQVTTAVKRLKSGVRGQSL